MKFLSAMEYLDEQRERIIQTYHELHALAEPSWEEQKTSQYLREQLEQAEFQVKSFHNHFGLVTEIPGKTNQVIALRADMDALVQEVNGEMTNIHSCGHDAHSTMVLHTALTMAAHNTVPRHTFRFIFQPAEEEGEGALQMLRDGALDQVKRLFGVHLRPAMEVAYGKAAPAILHGASATIRGVIQGLQAHASRPEYGKNAIEAASLVIQALQKVRLRANIPFSVKITQLYAGGKSTNVIPDRAVFALDLRAKSNEGMAELTEKTAQVFKDVESVTGTEIAWERQGYVPAATLHEEMINLAKQSIIKVLGPENLEEVCQTHGGEDFHFYTIEKPDLTATMIGLGCNLRPGLHHPEMKFDQEALIYGTKILVTALLEADKYY